jgi:hypothetical protein
MKKKYLLIVLIAISSFLWAGERNDIRDTSRTNLKFYPLRELLPDLLWDRSHNSIPQKSYLHSLSDSQENLQLFDRNHLIPMVNDSLNVTFVGQWPWGPCYDVEIKDSCAYIGNGRLLQILDLNDPSSPVILGEYLTELLIYDFEVSGAYAYLATGLAMEIVDISNPSNPVFTGRVERESAPYRELAVSSGYAYVGDFSGVLHIIDVSNPTNPVELSWINAVYETPRDIEVYGDYVYIIPGVGFGITILNVSDPENPQYEDLYFTNSVPTAIKVSGSYLFVGMILDPEFQILDISTPTEPTVLGSAHLNIELYPEDIEIEGNWAYLAIAGYVDGSFSIVDISQISDPSETSNIKLSNSVTAYGVALFSEYAYVSVFSGLSTVYVAEKDNPREVGFFPTGESVGRLKVIGNYNYLADGRAGLWIIDVEDPENPLGVGQFPVLGFAWDVDVEGDYCYIIDSTLPAGTSGGVWIIDVSDPTQPVEASNLLGIISWTYPLSALDVSRDYLYITIPPDSGLLVVDVSDPRYPQITSFFETEGDLYDVYVSGEYAYLANRDRGLRIIDVSEPNDPKEVGYWLQDNVVDVFVQDNLAFVASSVNLFILDVSDPANPKELGSLQVSDRGYDWELSVSNNYIYMAGFKEIHIIDFSIPKSPEEVGFIDVVVDVNGIDSKENLFYFGDSFRGLFIYQNDFLTGIRDNVKPDKAIPKTLSLSQNYPNPFNPSTTITFDVASTDTKQPVSLSIYDVRGRCVKTLINSGLDPGSHKIHWDGRDERGQSVSSGIYLYTLKAGEERFTHKMTVLK